MRLLAEHPEQWELLVEDPALAGPAVEEALRYEPITPFTARITTEEVDLSRRDFPEGTVVMVCAFTANRDLGEEGGRARGDDASTSRPIAAAGPAADIRRGRALLPGREPRPAELQEGLVVPRRALGGWSSTASRLRSVSGIYGLDGCRWLLRLRPEIWKV